MTVEQRPGVDFPGDERTRAVLRERAFVAMERAYAPYSNFRVGAALLATDGSVVEGCNVENAAFPAGICAERSAVAAAVTRGNRGFDAIVVATEAEEPTPPLRMGRQVLEEVSPYTLGIAVTCGGPQ